MNINRNYTMRINHFSLKLIFFLMLLSAGVSTIFSVNDSYNLTSQELKIRDGLPNFFKKVRNGELINVAYLGGSITAQPGWRVYSLEWMKNKFSQAKFEEIHAAIGGTGSKFGVFRLHEQVLQFDPDLLFIEFAVNDDKADSLEIIRSMEGIVRQTWETNPYTDICFVYTIKGEFLETESEGLLPKSAQIMEKVANKYGIPSINLGFEVAQQVKNDKLIFSNPDSMVVNGVSVFSPDKIHPYVETGHLIYNTVISRSIETMRDRSILKAKIHKLSKPMNSEYFSDTKMLDLSEVKFSDNWEFIRVKEDDMYEKFGRYLDQIGRTCISDETLTVHFRGKAVGIYDIMGPGACKIAVEIDGVQRDTISRFDKYCTYNRINYFVIDQLKDEEHQVIFKVIADPFDKQSILTRKEDFDQYPEKYKENCWQIGKILLDGYLIK